MTKTDQLLVLVLGGCVLLWLGLALFVLMTRALHDAAALAVRRARSLVVPDLEDALSGEDVDLTRLLRRLSRRTIERYAADTATPGPVAAVLAQHVLAHHPERILLRAGPGSRRASGRRIVALRVIARAGRAEALPLLEEALESGDEEVVAASITTLGEIGTMPAAVVLVSALRRDLFAPSRIAAQLDAFPQPIAGLILPLLTEQKAQLRFWGATLLARYAGDPAVDLELAAASGDVDDSVRAATVESLAAGGGPAAVGTALGLLDDRSWFVRAHAARALGSFGRPDLVALVMPLLADEAWWVRSAAKETVQANPPETSDMLVGYLDHEDRFARNGAAEILQNTGALDALIARAVEHGSDADLDELAKILEAGGGTLVAAAALRSSDGGQKLIARLARSGT